LTLAARCCALAPAADMDLMADAIDETGRRTDGQTPDRYMDPAPDAGNDSTAAEASGSPSFGRREIILVAGGTYRSRFGSEQLSSLTARLRRLGS